MIVPSASSPSTDRHQSTEAHFKIDGVDSRASRTPSAPSAAPNPPPPSYEAYLSTNALRIGDTANTAGPEGAHIALIPNDTLWGVATRHRMPGATTFQVAIALWRANPDAFENNDINCLKAGTSALSVPPLTTILLTDAANAQEIFAKQVDAYEQTRHGTTTFTARKNYAHQRQLTPGDSELVFFRDNLVQIAQRFDVAGATLDQKLVALFEANPHAFNRGNMNVLRTGVLLSMPTAERVHAMDNEAAQSVVAKQWPQFRKGSTLADA